MVPVACVPLLVMFDLRTLSTYSDHVPPLAEPLWVSTK